MISLDMTAFLYARPSSIEGLGKLIDFDGTMLEYNFSPSASVADYLALCSDWSLVGLDLEDSIRTFEDENPSLS